MQGGIILVICGQQIIDTIKSKKVHNLVFVSLFWAFLHFLAYVIETIVATHFLLYMEYSFYYYYL